MGAAFRNDNLAWFFAQPSYQSLVTVAYWLYVQSRSGTRAASPRPRQFAGEHSVHAARVHASTIIKIDIRQDKL